ncbi:MAG: HD domain-containing protein [Methanobacteriota archaeon]|nr:MAG: HD domain-containing protein [Euryarchaeota archaeon]
MDKAKVIRDPVHKDIFLSELEMRLVDTPEFQRLRRIKQLGVTNLVYPSANHTRFEHSIGAAHIAGRIIGRFDVGDAGEALRAAALLHDIGHGPLSHTSEELLKRHLDRSHEDATLSVIRESGIRDILSEYSVDPDVVLAILSKEHMLSGLISGEVDVDRMDYLARDAYHTGVAYGVIDMDRLVNTVELVDGDIVISQGGLRAVEGLLVARFLMTPTVYLHHTSRIADAMFLRATERAVEEGLLRLEDLMRMDDFDIQAMFRAAGGYVRHMGRRLEDRRLFKTAWFADETCGDEGLRESFYALMEDLGRWARLEVELAEDCGLEEGFVIVDITPRSRYEESNALIWDGEAARPVSMVSPIVRILQDTEASKWSVGVYAPQEHLERVRGICGNIKGYL